MEEIIINKKNTYQKRKLDIPFYTELKRLKNKIITENIIKKKYITELSEIKEKEIIYYKHLLFQGKKYYLMTKNSDVLKYNDLYYYCNNHRTTKLSEKLDNKGNKLRISICNSKIKYERDIDKYIFCEDHSEECDNLERAKITNIMEVKTGINNYENFTEALKEYLNKFPMITFHEFKVYAQNLYNEKNLELELNNSYYSNLYYNWRKKSRVFTKYSLFDNQLTDNGKQYMRDYTLTMLYKKNNKSQFQHEHVIYISDYFIK